MRADKIKTYRRKRRKRGIRKRIYGTLEMPRVTVFRSLKHICAQIIDDQKGITICSASTNDKVLRDKIKNGGNIEAAKIIGASLANLAKKKKIERVCFDRNGYRFGGRIKGLADALREGGLKF